MYTLIFLFLSLEGQEARFSVGCVFSFLEREKREREAQEGGRGGGASDGPAMETDVEQELLRVAAELEEVEGELCRFSFVLPPLFLRFSYFLWERREDRGCPAPGESLFSPVPFKVASGWPLCYTSGERSGEQNVLIT